MIAGGRVSAVRPPFVEVDMPPLPVETVVRVGSALARVVENSTGRVRARLEYADEIAAGDPVEEVLDGGRTVVGTALLGRAIDALGEPLDGRPAPLGRFARAEMRGAARGRVPVDVPIATGVRTIDALLTIGRGARVGIFGAPGAGKSTLLEAIVRGSDADAVVLALVGERAREANRWIARCDPHATIVCETSESDASRRVRAAHLAFAHARALAERGLHVLLVLDSLARVAYALREIAVSANEPAGRGGYPPRVFSELARLVESAGAFARGSVTLLATVLNDGDDRDPVSESARSLLDGHIQLDPALARAGRFPAVDPVASTSRVMHDVAGAAHVRAATTVRSALAALEASREARALGFEAAEPRLRRAIAAEDALERLLRQGTEAVPFARSLAELTEIADILEESHEHRL